MRTHGTALLFCAIVSAAAAIAQPDGEDGTAAREWLPGKYSAWSPKNKHVLRIREDGIMEFRNNDAREWAIYGFNTIQAAPGETYTFSCRSECVSEGAASSPFNLGVVLYDANGKPIDWHWGLVTVQPGESGETTFMVPNGAAAIQPRITGKGSFAAAFPQAKLSKAEGTEKFQREDDLPPALKAVSRTLEVSLCPSNGVFSVKDRRTGRTWSSQAGKDGVDRTMVIQSAMRKTMFALRFVDAEKLLRHTVVCRLEDGDAPEFTVELRSDPDTPVAAASPVMFPPPFATEKGDRLIIPYSEGIGVPATDTGSLPMKFAACSGHGLCMAFFGVAQDDSGAGWMAIFETPDDAVAKCDRVKGLLRIGPGWMGQKKKFGYSRRIRYVFLEKGGHVAMAARYRKYAEGRGLVKTFREKAVERPMVERLPGAANVWYFPQYGDPGPAAMAKNLKAAGVGRFLWSKGATAAVVKEITAMDGVLAGCYDVYQDVYHPEQLAKLGWKTGSNMDAWPQDIVWNSEKPGDWRRAWHVEAKDGTRTYCAMMCDSVAPAYARKRVAADLMTTPYTARFVDTTVSEPWQECYNPAHPMTRSESRYWKMELLRTIGDDFSLVVGSEQGHDACVPYCDYLEGMLSPGKWRMPHGGRQENFDQPEIPTNVPPQRMETVLTRELDPALRLPLWELVYHDCCAAHWYWYDYSNWPLSFWKRRDMFNTLYGTAGMFVFNGRLWEREKKRFAESYGTWGPVARRTGFSRMTDHRMLSKDRLVQQTVFSDGTVVTANFGETPFALPDGRTVAPMSCEIGLP